MFIYSLLVTKFIQTSIFTGSKGFCQWSTRTDFADRGSSYGYTTENWYYPITFYYDGVNNPWFTFMTCNRMVNNSPIGSYAPHGQWTNRTCLASNVIGAVDIVVIGK